MRPISKEKSSSKRKRQVSSCCGRLVLFGFQVQETNFQTQKAWGSASYKFRSVTPQGGEPLLKYLPYTRASLFLSLTIPTLQCESAMRISNVRAEGCSWYKHPMPCLNPGSDEMSDINPFLCPETAHPNRHREVIAAKKTFITLSLFC